MRHPIDNPLRRPIARLSVAAALLLPAVTAAQPLIGPATPPPALWTDHAPIADPIVALDNSLVWSRAVEPNLALLDRIQPGDELTIDVDPTRHYRAVLDTRQPNDVGGEDYIGHLDGLPLSRFVLSRVGDEIAATIEPHDGTPWLLNVMQGHGAHLLRAHASDVNRCGVDHSHLVVDTDQLHHAHATGGGCCDEPADVVKVMVVITPNAIAQVPGYTSTVGLALATMNLDLQSTPVAGFRQQMVLVGPIVLWQYSEPCDDLRLPLNSLRGDGAVAGDRDWLEADLVIGLVADMGSNCHGGTAGLAWLGDGIDDSLGFSVNRITLAPQVVSHECGHNFGCEHEDPGCSGATNNAWSTRCNLQEARTRMWATLGSSVVGFFSNPNFQPSACTGPLGRAGCANNVERIRTTRQGIANFRGGHLASSVSYSNNGGSYPGTNGIPLLRAFTPPVPGTTMTLRCTNSLGAATQGALLLGVDPDYNPTPFGGILILRPVIDVTFALGQQRGDVPIPLPADPALCGTRWRSQAVIIDPGATHGLAFTNGLIMDLGR